MSRSRNHCVVNLERKYRNLILDGNRGVVVAILMVGEPAAFPAPSALETAALAAKNETVVFAEVDISDFRVFPIV